MSHDPDLHHAISLRPSPYHAHPESSNRVVELPSGFQPVLPLQATKKPAATTSYEAVTPGTDTEAVSRPSFVRSNSDVRDVESQRLPSYTEQSDPYEMTPSPAYHRFKF